MQGTKTRRWWWKSQGKLPDRLTVERSLMVYRSDWTPSGTLPAGYECTVVDIVQDERGLSFVVQLDNKQPDQEWLVRGEDSDRFRLA